MSSIFVALTRGTLLKSLTFVAVISVFDEKNGETFACCIKILCRYILFVQPKPPEIAQPRVLLISSSFPTSCAQLDIPILCTTNLFN